MAAGFFNKLFSPKNSPAPNSEDVYQKVVDNQPQNVYREVSLLNGHTAPVNHLIKVNGSRFVTCSEDCRAIVWDSEHGYKLHVLEGHTSPITCILSVSSDLTTSRRPSTTTDSIILTGSFDKLIMWEMSYDDRMDPESTTKIITEQQGSIRCLVALRQNMVCSGGKDLCLWDVPNGRLLFKFDRSQLQDNAGSDEVHSVIELEGRSFGIVAVSDHHQPAIYDIKKDTSTQLVVYRLEFCHHLLSFHQAPITCLISITSNLFATGAEDGTVVVWSMNSLSAIKLFECSEESKMVEQPTASLKNIQSIPLRPYAVGFVMVLCQRYVFAAVGNGFKVFDVYSSDGSNSADVATNHRPLVSHTRAHTDTVTHMEFISDRCMLLTSSKDGSVRLWGPRNPPLKQDTSPYTAKDSVEVFIGLQTNRPQGKVRRGSGNITLPQVPLLLGELCLHSGTVKVVKDLGNHGLATCSEDGMVLLWKNLEFENNKKDQEIQKFLRGETYYDTVS